MKKKMKTRKKMKMLATPDVCVKVFGMLVLSCAIGHAQGDTSEPVANVGNYSMYGKAKISPKHVIIAVGDSLTQGYLSNGHNFHPYTTTLEEKLNGAVNRSRFEVLNEGFGGKCVFKSLMHKLPKILAKEKAKIDLVIILGGAEDIVSCYGVAAYMIKLHRMVHRAGLTSVVATIPARSDDNAKIEFARHKANTKLRVFQREHKGNSLLCDLDDKLKLKKRKYWDDSVHPNVRGYDKIANLLFETIKPELKKDGKLF